MLMQASETNMSLDHRYLLVLVGRGDVLTRYLDLQVTWKDHGLVGRPGP
jgi:hypothetical protein